MIAGLYGMNFKHMPETEWKYGYPTILGLMLGACFFLYRCFERLVGCKHLEPFSCFAADMP